MFDTLHKHRPAPWLLGASLAILAACDASQFEDGDGDGFVYANDCDDDDAAVHPNAAETHNGIDDDCDGTIDDIDHDGYREDQGDCVDDNPEIHPGVSEQPNGIDDDCDGQVDEDTTASDDDRDGYAEADGDCDDTNSNVSPGVMELCGNGIDDDCSGGIDDLDVDGDGFVSDACGGDDCDDEDITTHPDGEEVEGNFIDDDCDGDVDEPWWLDSGDTVVESDMLEGVDLSMFADCQSLWTGYGPLPEGSQLKLNVVYVTAADGTGKYDSAQLDEVVSEVNAVYRPQLGVTFQVGTQTVVADEGALCMTPAEHQAYIDTYAADSDEILVVITDDLDAATSGTGGTCDFEGGGVTGWHTTSGGVHGLVVREWALDEAPMVLAHELGHYFGLDHPHRGTCDRADTTECTESATRVAELVTDPNCTTTGDEVCSTPADPGPAWFSTPTHGCQVDFSTCQVSVDKDDNRLCGTDAAGAVYDPEVTNVMSYYTTCESTFTDEQVALMACAIDTVYGNVLESGTDNDGDGYLGGDGGTDCDDSNAAINPAATEVCDEVDNDCDGAIDTDAVEAVTFYLDADGDDYGDPGASYTGCDAPSFYVREGTDCDDADPWIYPGAPESCDDEVDYDCDGSAGDEDLDLDGYPSCLDCDDSDSSVSPDASDTCDGFDDDCSGYVDDGGDCGGDQVYGEDGTSYLFFWGDSTEDWATASSACQAIGYELAVPDTSEEFAFIVSWATLFDDGSDWWLGVYEPGTEGEWVTVPDAEALLYPTGLAEVDYTSWPFASGEPNDDGDEDCLELEASKDMKLNDAPCSDDHPYICESP